MKVQYLGSCAQKDIEERARMVATAAGLSRYDGTVTQLYESRNDYDKNIKLIKRVFGMGHTSIVEHDYLVFALEDVTPIIEQIIIGYRLTSFTIKSRRNVDFEKVGFYTPEFKTESGILLPNNAALQCEYQEYMNGLFRHYGKLANAHIPLEDCRYVLPYSYHSNIIMGCDVNELYKMVGDLLYGNVSRITEVRELGEKLEKLFKTYAPYVANVLDGEENKAYYKNHMGFVQELVRANKGTDYLANVKLLDKVKMDSYTPNPDREILISSLQYMTQLSGDECSILLDSLRDKETLKRFIEIALSNPVDDETRSTLEELYNSENPDFMGTMMRKIMESKNNRELEHALFKFQIPISLAVLTHYTRHRMHSLLVPNFFPLWNFDNYIIPSTIAKENEDYYRQIYAYNKEMMEKYRNCGVRDEDLVYFYLSGHACNITTVMDSKFITWLCSKRCCNKAQWETKDIADAIREYVRSVAPYLGENLGAPCEVWNKCPEGNDSCKARGLVYK